MSGKAFMSKTGTVWMCTDGVDIVFLVLEGHVDMSVTRPLSRTSGKRRYQKPVNMLFRNYFNLLTGEAGAFSKDSLMNKTAKRVK